jgi:ABC-type multidrug transport system fused ATPase/permease subunit
LKYRPTTEVVLDQLTFKALPGEKVGVVGRTGAGKSTICLSLSRIVEIVGGSIVIDGEDISKLDLKDLRASITVIPQDPTMFTGTLRFNLDPESTCSDERILEVLKKASLEDLLNREDKGLLTELTENGQNLSSGERQLICICRAILRSSKVVILDEATANIDVVTEQKIQTLIAEEFKQSTMITIAHRLNTIIKSDKVMVLSFGKILEYDSPSRLLSDESSHFS